MKVIDIKDSELDNSESCYHLTRAVHEESIAKNGLGADIGVRSKDGVGNEKTNKVFFAKSLEGTLIFLNRNLNIFYEIAKLKDFSLCRGALRDDSPELYEEIFNEMMHDNMSKKECEEVGIALGKLYLERGIYYKLNLSSSTKEEFENMSEEDKEKVDYLLDDINEERPDEHMTINNMHTRSGKGVPSEKMALMNVNGKKSSLDIVIGMAEYFRSQNPGKPLPVIEYKNGKKDKPLLENLVDRLQEKDKENTSMRKLIEDVSKNFDIRAGEVEELKTFERVNSEKENEGVSKDE